MEPSIVKHNNNLVQEKTEIGSNRSDLVEFSFLGQK
jgi:hypothetical protein